MRDQPYGVDQQRAHPPGNVRVFDRGLPRQGLYRDTLVSFINPIKAGYAVDVDQVRGPGQAEVQQGDQGLPAGQHLGVL
jgi:hypothetical protein